MKTLFEPTTDQILMMWEWCVETYLQYGIKLTFPCGTDPTKTYQWRYAKAIFKKLTDLGLEEQTIKYVLKIAVQRAKQAGMLQKGLSAILQNNLLEICTKQLDQTVMTTSTRFEVLQRAVMWLHSQRGSDNLLRLLAARPHPDSFCNLTLWYQANRIPLSLLCFSRACGSVLDGLSATERSFYPSPTKLYLARMDFLGDKDNQKKLRNLFGNDWR